MFYFQKQPSQHFPKMSKSVFSRSKEWFCKVVFFFKFQKKGRKGFKKTGEACIEMNKGEESEGGRGRGGQKKNWEGGALPKKK